VVDALDRHAAAGLSLERDEVVQPRLVRAAEEDRRAVGGGDRREVGLAGTAAALEHGSEQRLGAPRGRLRVGALDRHRHYLGIVAGPVVEHDPDIAVLPELDRLAAVRADVAEAERAQQLLGLLRRLAVDADLHEREPVERR
jgi:hypothetical protein